MRNRPILTFIGVVLYVLITANISIAKDFHPGASWLRFSEDSRFMWAWGAIDGQSLILEEIDKENFDAKDNHLPPDNLNAMLRLMTQYYQDASNTNIPWKYMAVVASMKLAGRSEDVIMKRLENLRAYGAWLLENRKKNKTP